MSSHDIDDWCPECGESQLNIIERNYHGCGVDIAFCDNCQRTYQISYKIDQITEINQC